MREECFNPNNGDRPQAPNLAIIVTDGKPYPESRWPLGVAEARAVRDSGRFIFNGFYSLVFSFLVAQKESPCWLNLFLRPNLTLCLKFLYLPGPLSVTTEVPSLNLASFGNDFFFLHSGLLIAGINVIAVGITDSIDAEFLRLLSGQQMSHTGQLEGIDYFKSPDFLSLNNILGTVVTSACETPDPSASHFLFFNNL